MNKMQDINELFEEERERLIAEYKAIPKEVLDAEEARRSAKFQEEQAKRDAHKMEELEDYFVANGRQIYKDVARELVVMRKTQTEDSWIHYGEGEPVVGICLEDGEQRVVLYYSFEDLDTYKVI